LIRYADDFVVMTTTESKAKEALRQIQFVMNKLGLVLHPEKTRMVELRRGKGSFVFLGCTIRKKRSILRNPRWYFMHRWPSPKATKRLRDRVREITDSREFLKMDGFVYQRITRWFYRRGGQRPTKQAPWTGQQLHDMGLYRLRGHVSYAAQATPVRSSVSRVRARTA